MNDSRDLMIIIVIMLNVIIFWFLFSRSWLSLAKLYKTNQVPPPNIRYMRHGSVGGIRYKGTLNVGITLEGIYLSIIPPFNIGSSPLLIPWSAIDKIEKVNSFFIQSYRLYIKNSKTTIILNKEELAPAKGFLAQRGMEL
ncbi:MULTISPECIES: hypothetical protein [Aerosakkonema]|uniref:hypothetical protein n=1 Tax=Aerosakkonema TaxID=1246629 RepID=UPI0035B7A24A